ncbi:MAG: hypothetical protein WA208_19750 [Thermoanaerobaculia bacterium]
MNLLVAAALLVAIAAAHSYLGERYILIRLFRRGDLPKLRGSDSFTKATLRFAWHITSVAWLGFAAVLVTLSRPPIEAGSVARIVGATFLVSAAVSAVGGRGRHYSWIVFLAIGLLAWFAS